MTETQSPVATYRSGAVLEMDQLLCTCSGWNNIQLDHLLPFNLQCGLLFRLLFEWLIGEILWLYGQPHDWAVSFELYIYVQWIIFAIELLKIYNIHYILYNNWQFAVSLIYYYDSFSNAVFGHSVVVYSPTDEILSCARIKPLLEKEINISFPREGVKINRYFASVQHGCLFHTAII